ncbi:hypothetical protein GQ457_09G019850 [Hibiscus cannabinus]
MQHGWEKFARQPDEKDLKKNSINVTLVKEFYANFIDPNQGIVYVKTERVEFTAKAINKFFALKRTVDLYTPFVNRITRKQSLLLFPRLITALCRQKGVTKDEFDFYIRGRQGIKPSQIPSLMGFDEDAIARAPLGGAHTIAAVRLAKFMVLTEKTQEQVQDMQEKITSLFHYMHKTTSPEEHADPTIPHAQTPTSTPRPSAKNTTATRHTLTRKDKGKAPAKPNSQTPTPEATVELDSTDDDEEMPDAPQPPAPAFDTSVPRHRLKRKANKNINTADLAAEDDDASDAEEDNGSNTTPEETQMTGPQ